MNDTAVYGLHEESIATALMQGVPPIDTPGGQAVHQPDEPMVVSVEMENVLTTAELNDRPTRQPNYETEARALASLAHVMSVDPRSILQKLVDLARNVCQADSAGVSILECNSTEEQFRWHATAGRLANDLHKTVPRKGSISGTVLDKDAVLLFAQPDQHFIYPEGIELPIHEALLVPFHNVGRPVGTVWVVAHTPEKKFDREDARILTSLSQFAAAAYQMTVALEAVASSNVDLEERVNIRTRELTDANEQLRREVNERERLLEEQSRLRTALEAEQSLMRSIIDQMPAGVLVVDAASGRTIVANALAEYLRENTTTSEVELFHTTHHQAHSRSAEVVNGLLAQIRAGECVHGIELKRPLADGRVMWLRVNGAPVRQSEGAVSSAVVVLDDVTSEKEAEEVLRSNQAVLEARVTEKVAELEAESNKRHAAETARQQLVARITTISEEERRRLSRELHDETSQMLTSLMMGLKRVRDEVAANRALACSLEVLQQQADLISESIHRIALELRPAALDAMGLGVALQSWVERWAKWTGIAVDFHSTLRQERLPSEVETQLYRITTEALSNIAKHARATWASVLLDQRQDLIVAAIEDNGTGFNPESLGAGSKSERLGLVGMKERAMLLGGNLHIESSPGKGTTVLVRIPVNIQHATVQ